MKLEMKKSLKGKMDHNKKERTIENMFELSATIVSPNY